MLRDTPINETARIRARKLTLPAALSGWKVSHLAREIL